MYRLLFYSLFIIFKLTLGLNLYGQKYLSEVRVLYEAATLEACEAEKLLNFIEDKYLVKDFPVFLAYLGSSQAMMADCVSLPHKKLSYFKEGTNNINKAVSLAIDNHEIRFLRLQIQVHSPDFLNYNNEIVEDKKMIFEYFQLSLQKGVVEEYTKYLAKSLQQTVNLNVEEKQIIQNIITD